MGISELILIAVGLSMDAFAVAVCAGLSMKQADLKKVLTIGIYFGVFQGGMPWLGYLAASRFSDYVIRFDHWIAFILLSVIGGKMVVESSKKESYSASPKEISLKPQTMLPLALATSIDALAVGISFAFLQVDILPASVGIGATTLLLSMGGVKMGKAFGVKLKSKAELAGGVILALIGLKILFEHTGVF